MNKTAKLPDAVHVELLASVFATVAPPLIMSVLFAAVGGLVAQRSGDGAAILLYVAGLVATVGRLGFLLAHRRRGRAGDLPPDVARVLETRFAATYLAFALAFGLFAGRVLSLGATGSSMLVAVLVTGYSAGVATGVAMRPRIGIAAMAIATLPAIVAAALRGDAEHLTLAVTLAGLLAGGIRSTLVRYHVNVADIGRRHDLAMLARTDPLTGLPNRLALGDHLDAAARSGRGATIFCVDLDDFKPVNDRFGHLAGDAVLCEAAGRLTALLWQGDIAARVGGDEFVVVRSAVGSSEEREVAALRLHAALAEPFWIGDERVSVGASVGTALLDPHGDPRWALAEADQDLYRSKRTRMRPFAPSMPKWRDAGETKRRAGSGGR